MGVLLTSIQFIRVVLHAPVGPPCEFTERDGILAMISVRIRSPVP